MANESICAKKRTMMKAVVLQTPSGGGGGLGLLGRLSLQLLPLVSNKHPISLWVIGIGGCRRRGAPFRCAIAGGGKRRVSIVRPPEGARGHPRAAAERGRKGIHRQTH